MSSDVTCWSFEDLERNADGKLLDVLVVVDPSIVSEIHGHLVFEHNIEVEVGILFMSFLHTSHGISFSTDSLRRLPQSVQNCITMMTAESRLRFR